MRAVNERMNEWNECAPGGKCDAGDAWGDRTVPRSRDGVNATGRTREAEGLSKRVFYHSSAAFDRRGRGRARRAGAVDGIGFTRIHTERGFGRRPVSRASCSFARRCARDVSDGTNRRHRARWISFRFVLRSAFRVVVAIVAVDRSFVRSFDRSIGRDRRRRPRGRGRTGG